jgi:predicted metalloprotease
MMRAMFSVAGQVNGLGNGRGVTMRLSGRRQSGNIEDRRGMRPGRTLAAATAIGDDRLQKQSQGYVVPDAFTHGTSAQRARWFRLGFETGDLSQGDTFNIDYEDL